MSTEVHAIPPAPRNSVRWGTAMAYRWPLAVFAFLLAIYGGLWTLMLLFASQGKPLDDARLDHNPSIASGLVIDVRPTNVEIGERPAIRVDFHFTHGGEQQLGASFAPTGLQRGDETAIEYLTDAVHISRIRGGRISLLDDFVTPVFWITVVPGLALFLLWVHGGLRTRRVLVHGDVAAAHVLESRELRYVMPTMLSVHFSFRDRTAQTCVGHHWVRARSSLGSRLLDRPTSVAVIHDRERPNRHRMVVADEFARRLRDHDTGRSAGATRREDRDE